MAKKGDKIYFLRFLNFNPPEDKHFKLLLNEKKKKRRQERACAY